jgi:ubiquitin-conjugating enzyme E2 M
MVQFLLLEPNASDPLNKEAAEELRHNKDVFRRNSRTACMGGYVHGEKYDRVFKVFPPPGTRLHQ